MDMNKFCPYCDGYPCICEDAELARSHAVEPPPWKDKAIWVCIAIMASAVLVMVGSSWL